MSTLIVPIGGLGTRFSSQGFTEPKPLIDIKGRPMIIRALETIDIPCNTTIIGLRRFEGYQRLIDVVKDYDRDIEFYLFDEVTEGPAITVKNLIQRLDIPFYEPFFTMNCDQIMSWNGRKFYEFCINSFTGPRPDGVVVTFEGGDTRHSFVKLNEKATPILFKEKEKISNVALTGIHYWRNTEIYVNAVINMVRANDRAPNKEFYIAPAYNHIANKDNLFIYHIPRSTFHPVGTPEELQEYTNANI